MIYLKQNLSYENEFDLHDNEPVGGNHFRMNCFARRLVLTQRQKVTRKDFQTTLEMRPHFFLFIHIVSRFYTRLISETLPDGLLNFQLLVYKL